MLNFQFSQVFQRVQWNDISNLFSCQNEVRASLAILLERLYRRPGTSYPSLYCQHNSLVGFGFPRKALCIAMSIVSAWPFIIELNSGILIQEHYQSISNVGLSWRRYHLYSCSNLIDSMNCHSTIFKTLQITL